MNKAYWNGHELRGPITMEKPECIGTIELDIDYPLKLQDYVDHLASLPILLSSGFEGMGAGEVEYYLQKNWSNGMVWYPASDETYDSMPENRRTIIAIPATPKASEPTERFKMPEDSEVVKAAILFNDGKIEPEQLSNMVGLVDFILNRLYENGDIKIPSSKES